MEYTGRLQLSFRNSKTGMRGSAWCLLFFSFRMNSVSPIHELVIQGIPQAKNSPNFVGLEAFFE